MTNATRGGSKRAHSMNRLGRVPRRLLLAAHLLCAAAWIGGIVSLLLLSLGFGAPSGRGVARAVVVQAMGKARRVDLGSDCLGA